MDSFFSLFDPSDSNQSKQNNKKRHKNDQDNARKNPDAPKGRRRGRRSQGKNETLPEESSFLCEPDLSTEILVKDYSYIENHIEVNKPDDDNKGDDKRPRRRNSGRKNRRKKNKISPAKDLPNPAWQETQTDVPETLNNQSSVPKICDEKIGKNVNDLKSENDFKRNRRKSFNDDLNEGTKFADRVYNVIDKLEKVRIKDDMYLAGDFSSEDLESDLFYSSDDMEEFCEETSDGDDSGDECYGSLPPEPRFGNVEYKLQLVSPCERRFQHLVTQLKWRLRSGGGAAVYVVGVRDCGALRGLRPGPLKASLRALRDMARALGAVIVSAKARKVAPGRAVAEVYIRKLADTQQSVELRVAVMGANEAGKSTLIGVLTQGELDNGRGSARLNMFRHLHEVKSGRTSSLSHEILGFDAQGNVVNYGCSELMTAERIGERSAKLVSFLDLAGHSKYQRTTLHGLTGYSPHYAMVVISATAGITRITEEHIGLLLALDMPFFAVINKCELANNINNVVTRLAQLLEPANKKPLLITDENMARNCVAPHKSILDIIDNGDEDTKKEEEVAVFPVSCVRGVGLNALHACLLALRPAPPAAPRPEDITELVQTSQTSEKNRKNARRQNKNILQDIANAQSGLIKNSDTKNENMYMSDDENKLNMRMSDKDDRECVCDDIVFLEDPNDPRGCIYFQASVHVLRHSTAIYPGFQCSVHVGNVRQTAIIEGIMSPDNVLRAGEGASVLFRFSRCPEYLVKGRRLIFTAGLGTRAIGRVTQTFPYIP